MPWPLCFRKIWGIAVLRPTKGEGGDQHGSILMLKVSEAIRPIQPVSFLSQVSRQANNYSTVVGWLLYRGFKGRTAKLVIAIVLSLVHLGSQAAAIYAVYWYGRQMEQSGVVSVPFLKIAVNLKEQPQWLWAVVAVSTCCFVVSAAFLYLSHRQVLDIVEHQFARNSEQLVMLSLRLPDPRARLASRLMRDLGISLLMTGCRRGALTTISFANAIAAVVGGLGATVFLLRIDPSLTVVILVSVGLAALLLYPLTLRGVETAKNLEKTQATFKENLRNVSHENSVEEAALGFKAAGDVAAAWMMRRRVVTELIFATEIGITVLLGIVIYHMASQALAGKEQWAIFIAYVGALRMTLNGAGQAIRTFANVSRFYPQIVRYYLFMKDVQQIDSASLVEMRRGDKVILGTLRNGQDVVAEAGDCLAMLTTGKAREPLYALVDAKLELSSEPVAAAMLDLSNARKSAAGLALIRLKDIENREQFRFLLEDVLKDKVTFIVYYLADKVGSFGEKYALTTQDGELHRFIMLGTEEGDVVLKEFGLKASKRAMKAGLPDDDDEDEDDDDT